MTPANPAADAQLHRKSATRAEKQRRVIRIEARPIGRHKQIGGKAGFVFGA